MPRLKAYYDAEAVICTEESGLPLRVSSIKSDRARLSASSLLAACKKFRYATAPNSRGIWNWDRGSMNIPSRRRVSAARRWDATTWKIQVACQIPRRNRKKKKKVLTEKLNRCILHNQPKFHRSYTVTHAVEELLAAWSSACVPRIRSRWNSDRCPFYGD